MLYWLIFLVMLIVWLPMCLHHMLLQLATGKEFKIVCKTFSNGATVYAVQGLLAGRWRDVYVDHEKAHFHLKPELYNNQMTAMQKLHIAKMHLINKNCHVVAIKELH